MIYAHTITYPELLASKEAVTDLQGRMIGGPDTKTVDEITKWSLWGKAVVSAAKKPGVVPPDVMKYFQATKHLSRPPKEGDLNILGDGLIEDALVIKDVADFMKSPDVPPYELPEIVIKPFKPPRFTWSYTSMQEFLTCPAQWAAKRYYKTIKDVPGEAMRVGNLIHETAEHYLKSKIGQSFKPSSIHGAYLPMVQKYCDALVASGAELHVEKEMCFTDKFKPCGWKDWDTVWVRSKGDVLAKKGNKISILDWKSGKFKEDFLQLKIFAIFAALTPGFEDVQEFDPKFIFLKETDPAKNILRLPKPMHRSELRAELAKVLEIVRRMEASWSAEAFPCKKNGLCRNRCSNTDCPHCGG